VKIDMSLVDTLKASRERAIDEKVVEFAEQMEPIIIQSSNKGYASYLYRITEENSNKHIMCSDVFIERLQILMDGVKVEFQQVGKKMLITHHNYYENYIRFTYRD